MKISPVAAPSNSVSAQGNMPSAVQSLRAMTMNTNATPGYIPPPTDENLPISDTIEDGSTVEVTQPISPQFAALAKQRRALQVREQALIEREKRLESMPAEGEYVPKSRLKSETLKVLQEAGALEPDFYNQMTEYLLENQGNPEINALKAEIDSLKKGVDQRFTDQVTQQEKQVLAEMQREASLLVTGDDNFELVRETRSIPKVMQLIERNYRETGEVLDVTEALQLVEDELFSRNQKIANLKKMQSLFNKPEQTPMPQPRTGMRTLTNQHTASVPMDRKARALAAALGTLKK